MNEVLEPVLKTPETSNSTASAHSVELEPLLATPRLRQLIDELETTWQDEQRKRQEFYDRIQPNDKWEFINGQIIMHSPAKDKHTEARKNLTYLLQTHVEHNQLGEVRDENALVALTRNDYLPDIVFFGVEKAATIEPDTWKYPIPDFVVEVLSDSTEGTDRNIKKEDYATHGAREYWLVDPTQQTVEQFLLDEEGKEFRLFSKKTVKDLIECQVLSGLSFPVAAIFDKQIKLNIVRSWLAK